MGYKHYQLEDHPRKRHCVWTEVPVKISEAEKLLNNPPKPVDDEVPGQLPNDMLNNWGILCSVEPEDITEDTLNQGPLVIVPHHDTTN